METEGLHNPVWLAFLGVSELVLGEYVAQRRAEEVRRLGLGAAVTSGPFSLDGIGVSGGGGVQQLQRHRRAAHAVQGSSFSSIDSEAAIAENDEDSTVSTARPFDHGGSFDSAPRGVRSGTAAAGGAGSVKAAECSLSPGGPQGVRTVLFCVPQALSLRGRPGLADVRSHILVPVEESSGEFRSLDGQRVLFRGSRIVVPEPVPASAMDDSSVHRGGASSSAAEAVSTAASPPAPSSRAGGVAGAQPRDDAAGLGAGRISSSNSSSATARPKVGGSSVVGRSAVGGGVAALLPAVAASLPAAFGVGQRSRVWPKWEARSVHILCTEDVPFQWGDCGNGLAGSSATPGLATGGSACSTLGGGLRLRVLYIDRPLRGGCRSSCTLEGMDLLQVRRFVCLLRAMPEHEELFQEVDELVQHVNSSLRGAPPPTLHSGISVDDRLNNLRRVVRYCVKTAAGALVSHSDTFALLLEPSQAPAPHLRRVLQQLQRKPYAAGAAGAASAGASTTAPAGIATATPPAGKPAFPEEGGDERDEGCEAESCCAVRRGSRLVLGGGLASQVKRHTEQLEQVIEGYLLMGTHDALMTQVRLRCGSSDARFNAAAAALRARGLSQHDLGVRPEFQCSQRSAIALLSRLGAQPSALSKLLCLSAVANAVNSAVEQSLRTHVAPDDLAQFQLATDDVLDQLIFALVWTDPSGLGGVCSQVEFVRRFHTMNVNTASVGFTLANVEVAVQWVLSRGAELGPTMTERLRQRANDAAQQQQQQQQPLHAQRGATSERYVVVEAGSYALQAAAGLAVLERSAEAVDDVAQLACSKFTPELFCSVGGSGRVRMSTGLHSSRLSRRRFVRAAVGENFVVAVEAEGALYTWGANGDGQLGLGKDSVAFDRCATPMQVLLDTESSRSAVDVACGARHALALASDGEVFSWGRGGCGRLGHGSVAGELSPRLVEGLGVRRSGRRALALAAGYSHSLVLVSGDEEQPAQVMAFGCARDGRLGTGCFADAFLPESMELSAAPRADPPVAVAAGYAHSAVLPADGRVLVCGLGALGQLGLGRAFLADELLHGGGGGGGGGGRAHGGGVPGSSFSSSSSVSSRYSSHSPPASAGSPVGGYLSPPVLLTPPAILGSIRGPAPRPAVPELQTVRDEDGQASLGGESFAFVTHGSVGAAAHVGGGGGGSSLVAPSVPARTPKARPFDRGGAAAAGLDAPFMRNGAGGTVCLAPVPVPALAPLRAVSLDCGRNHTACVTSDGHAWLWGLDERSGLVHAEPHRIPQASPAADAIVCAASTTFLLFSDGGQLRAR